ncbi:YwqJ-related putative deaminase [Actinacidiphila sp. ITFR-21]|uniref:YwqJ-related putative deaminase n=1 Tax=Actinacidiphila sp. ITFR-21 TaxID=3075199 RepID=UPI00288ADF3E|nr:YwqJ-related putative deaminase [Streptomyces sp. ITFR-21]WNI15845.1 YwqJ-related putative deaminase [Streptomyces sp. ITFR-21]
MTIHPGAAGAADPRPAWSAEPDGAAPPVLRHRRDGILPAVAAALFLPGEVLTCTGSKAEQPAELHPVVRDFLDALPVGQRERFAGRCPEAVLLSRHLRAVEAGRGRRAARHPLTRGEARRSLRGARLTARRIREDGDPAHGAYAPPCRSCAPLLAHLGVRPFDPDAEGG